MEAALIMLVWNRIRRIERQVLLLISAINAGQVWTGQVWAGPVRTRRDEAERVEAARVAAAARAAQPSVPRGPEVPRLPRRFAWLLPMVPYEAAGFASQLRHTLSDPEMVALLAASPRLGAVLRPLCRMLGLEPALVMPVVVDGVTGGPAKVHVAGTNNGTPSPQATNMTAGVEDRFDRAGPGMSVIFGSA